MPKLIWASSANIWSFDDKAKELFAKNAAKLPKDGDRLELGKYVGLMTKISKRNSPKTGEIDEGMYGSFFAVPANGGDMWATHVLYLPDPLMGPILARFRGDDRVANLVLGYKLAAVRDTKSAAGFAFDIKPEFAPYVDDPMERIWKLLGIEATAADTAEANKQDEAAGGKGKGKGKGK